jgi:hypothetical protein
MTRSAIKRVQNFVPCSVLMHLLRAFSEKQQRWRFRRNYGRAAIRDVLLSA